MATATLTRDEATARYHAYCTRHFGYIAEHATIDTAHPLADIRDEVKDFLGLIPVSNANATEIWDELTKLKLPQAGDYVFIPGGDFMTIVATIIEI